MVTLKTYHNVVKTKPSTFFTYCGLSILLAKACVVTAYRHVNCRCDLVYDFLLSQTLDLGAIFNSWFEN